MQADKRTIPFEFERQMYFVKPMMTVQDVIDFSEFFKQGWEQLNDMSGARGDISWDGFLKRLFYVATGSSGNGIVFVMTSKSLKPLGFMVIQNDSESEEKKTCVIYAGYSTGKDANGYKAGMAFAERWAQSMRFVELHAQTRRISGAAMRFFRSKLNFEIASVVMRKTI